MASRPTHYTPASSQDSVLHDGLQNVPAFHTAFAGHEGCHIRYISVSGSTNEVVDAVQPWPLGFNDDQDKSFRIQDYTCFPISREDDRAIAREVLRVRRRLLLSGIRR